MSVYGQPDAPLTLPTREALLERFSALNRLLANEDAAYRPRDAEGQPGGLIELDRGIPTVALPDIHARPAFVRAALDYPLASGGMTVAAAVRSGAAQLVCVGDYFHGEGRAARRWRRALVEFAEGFIDSPAMDEEMAEGLAVLEILGQLKLEAPRYVHLLKGNHENVANEEGGGNHQFGKFAYEGAMVAAWVPATYGEAGLLALYEFEKRLPLVAVGNRFVISHAEPARRFTREGIIGYRTDEEVVYGLTWTADDEAEEGGTAATMAELLPIDRRAGALWFGGHRPVAERYALRADGRYVQFHNPGRRIIGVFPPDESPDPERDIREINDGDDPR